MFDKLLYWVKMAAIYFLFLQSFVLAALEKWTGGGVPEWFTKQFGPSVMGKFPGLAASFYGIAVGETVVALLFVASLAMGEVLPGRPKTILKFALASSALMFAGLGFGQRLTQEFTGAAQLVGYFVTALVTLFVVEHEEAK